MDSMKEALKRMRKKKMDMSQYEMQQSQEDMKTGIAPEVEAPEEDEIEVEMEMGEEGEPEIRVEKELKMNPKMMDQLKQSVGLDQGDAIDDDEMLKSMYDADDERRPGIMAKAAKKMRQAMEMKKMLKKG